MASVFLEDGTWVVKWKDATGQWRKKRTKCERKPEAKRIAADLERQAERQQLGLEARPSDCTMTLAELCRWWLEHHCPERSREVSRYRLECHVCAHPLGSTPLPRATTEAIEGLLSDQKRPDGSAPSGATINRTRSDLHSVFERAIKTKRWSGPNPVAGVEARRVKKPTYKVLRAEEVAVLLPHVPVPWRPFIAAALWTGLRKGELCGLTKDDVDLDRRILTVARSYENDTTKGNRTDALPIAEPLIPYLKEAIDSSPSKWVFPDADGAMRTKESDPQKVLRRSLVSAGLIEGWEHVCRRCKAAKKSGHTTRHPDATIRRCGTCGMRLWPRALPKVTRLHDLRHSVATLLLHAGVDAHRVQRVLRHASITTTTGTYGHLNVEDLRAAMATLPDGPPVVRSSDPRKDEARNRRVSSADSGLCLVGPTGVEPVTPTVSR